MKPERWLFFVPILLLVIPTCARAQAWSGIIDPSRAVDWSNAGIPGGIPIRTTICATLNPGATSTQINSAIASCPSGQVVFLNAGTYVLSAGINFNGRSNVTLRGAGPMQTILQFTGGDGCGGLGGDVCVTANPTYFTGSVAVQPGGGRAANWTAGYAQGTTQITLDSVAGLSVGQTLVLDQANDSSDTGGVYVCDTTVCSSEGGSPGRTINSVDYNQQQIVTITAIKGTTVTISPGLYMTNWRSGLTPKAWWWGMISGVGVEAITLDHSISTSALSGVYFYNCHSCWVQNVRSLNAHRNHVWLYESDHVVVRDSYFYGVQGGGSQSYGVEPYYTADDLIENNIFDHITSPIVAGNMTGVVAGYNFSIQNTYTTTPTYLQDMYSSHDAGDAMNLFEGNEAQFVACDNIHGTSQGTTYFRNRLTGWESGKTQQTVPILLDASCRGYSVIGNVLGTSGYHNNYEAFLAGVTNCATSTYNINYWNGVCGSSTLDTLTRSTLMRWGNYDVVTGSVKWNSSEVPTTGVPFMNGNPVPASHNLPASFYLSSRPSGWWATPWGTPAWPPIGPDVAGGNISGVGGYANMIPAHLCYNNTSQANGVLNFIASACYGSVSASAPAPPANLTVVVH